MFEPPASDSLLDAELAGALTQALATADGPADDRARLDLVRALEALKDAASGLQAKLAVDIDASVRRRETEEGVVARLRGRGVAAELALARRESPFRGRQHLGLATTVSAEMPYTWEAMREGRLSEWRATLLARETACLAVEHRREVDRRLAGDPQRLEGMGDRALASAARRIGYQLDPGAWVKRRRIAESERRVTLRAAPDVMSHLSAALPAAQGVALIKALGDHADALRAAGDARTRGQLMADTLVGRVLGTEQPDRVAVRVNVVVSAASLFGAEDYETRRGAAEDAAELDGYGPIPAELARELAKAAAEDDRARLRRLYAAPESGELISADSGSHRFPLGLARLIRLRDQTCRTPWCDAPIRRVDHARAAHDDGPVGPASGQGLCEACSNATQAPGWRAGPAPGRRHTIETWTALGLAFRSTAPPLPGGGHADYVFPIEIVA